MSDYITTYSGIHFEPMNPDIEKIYIEDIAHALSMLCRGNGHVKQFHSVAQHCLWCAEEAKERGYSERVQLACLLHDASEAYMADVPSPLKKQLAGYRQAENHLLELVYEKYIGQLMMEEKEKVDEIDHTLLKYDLFYLLGEGKEDELPPIKTKAVYEKLGCEVVAKKYLERFYEME